MKVCINNPLWLNKKSVKNYLGARYTFLLNYADAIYFDSKVLFVKWLLTTDTDTKQFIIKNKKIIFNIETVNSSYDVFITLNNPPVEKSNFLKKVKIMKINAIYDYNYKVHDLKRMADNASTDYLIGHALHDRHDPFFRKYLQSYAGRVINFPIGYPDEFTSRHPEQERISKIVGLGAISSIKQQKDNGSLSQYYTFLTLIGRSHSHLDRQWFRSNEDTLSDCFDSYFPHPPLKRDIYFNEQEALSRYMFFLNDLGSLTFLPARMYEGIGLGSIPFAIRHPIYKEYGLNDDNMIMFDSLDEKVIKKTFYAAMDRISFLQKNITSIQKKYTFEAVSKDLYKNIDS